jgi:hypothetical protein
MEEQIADQPIKTEIVVLSSSSRYKLIERR